LNDLAKLIAQRSAKDLNPISDAGVPLEVRSLTHTINTLLQRLGSDLNTPAIYRKRGTSTAYAVSRFKSAGGACARGREFGNNETSFGSPQKLCRSGSPS
jgi:hypothetical protein